MTSSRAAPTLLADLGGTNVRFAIADPTRDQPLLKDSILRYRDVEHASLEDAISTYFRDSGYTPKHAIIAAAGRIINDESVKITNNPWEISVKRLTSQLGLDSVKLVNDFAVQSMAVLLLNPEDLVPVGSLPLPELGRKDTQSFVIIGPGTGLGVGGLLLRPGGHSSVLETEGGHAGFAAHSAEDIEILKRLNERFGRVSNERLISGSGLANVYAAVVEIAGQTPEPLKPEDITARAKDGSDPLCRQAVETFVGIFGSIAGDLVLSIGGWDGVYLTGGLAPIVLPWLQAGGFRQRFEAKGRFQDSMRQVPTQVIMNPEPGLIGAAALSVALAGGKLRQRFSY